MKGKIILVKFIVLITIVLFALNTAIAPTDAQGSSESSSMNLPTANQPAKFKRYTIDDGLAANQTYNVLQSKEGFIWIATREGLSKFDGSEFTNYTHNPDDPNSTASDYVWTIREAPDGALWLSLWGGGMDRFDPVTETFTHYRSEKNNPNSLSTDFITLSFQDSKGNIWVATEKGLDKMDPQTNTITHYQSDPNNLISLGAPVNTIQEDDDGTLWLGTYSGLDRFDPATEIFIHYHHQEDNPNSLNGGYVWSLFIDSVGIIWVGTDSGGLNRFDPTTETFTHYQHMEDDPTSLSNDTVTFLGPDKQDGIWVGTLGGGLNKFDPQTGRFTTFQYDKDDPNSLSNNTVWSVIEDKAGAYWIATESGLNYYDPQGHHFNIYRSDPANPNSLSSDFIMSFYEDEQGILWIGTMGGGLNKFDRRQGTFTHYQNDPSNPNSLVHNDVNRIAPGRNGALWLGTSGGLDRFDPSSETFAHYLHDPANPNSLLNNNIQGLIRDTAGKLWLASYLGGISHFDPNTETFTHFSHDENDPNSLASNATYDFLEASDGVIWVAAQGGLSRLDPRTNKFTNFTNEENHLSDAVIEDVYEDSRGVIWVSTDNGLNKFDPETQTFFNYFVKNGLPSNHVSGLIEDNQGYLWIATYRGIAKFDPQAETFRIFDERDGLQDNQFSQAIYRSKSGELFLGGVNGFNTFYPDKLVDNSYIPRVILTDFRLLNQPVEIGGDSPLQKHINVTDHLALPYNYTVLTLKFAALNYRSPQKNQYAYMLEGFDQDWVQTGSTNRLATYTNLDPGEYTFRVKASNNDGVWNEEGTSLKITITPPWWETWWFRGVATAALLALAFGSYRWRVSSIKQRSQELERQVTERTAQLEAANKELEAFAYSVSHDLRAPLRHINGFLELLQQRTTGTLDERSRYYMGTIFDATKRMGQLIDDLLSFSRMGRTEMSSTLVDLAALVQDIIQELMPETQGRTVNWCIAALPTITGDQAMLRLVMVNLIANALKFTRQCQPAEIEIGCFPDQDSKVVVFIRDNGVGFDMAYADKLFGVFQRLHRVDEFEGTGIGLANVRRIINRHGGHTWAEGQVNQGATFYFSLPAIYASNRSNST